MPKLKDKIAEIKQIEYIEWIKVIENTRENGEITSSKGVGIETNERQTFANQRSVLTELWNAFYNRLK